MKKTKNFNCIKSVLAMKGKSQIWLAEKLGVHQTTVSTWCTNTKQPKYSTLYEIAALLDIEMRELLTKMKDIREIEVKGDEGEVD